MEELDALVAERDQIRAEIDERTEKLLQIINRIKTINEKKDQDRLDTEADKLWLLEAFANGVDASRVSREAFDEWLKDLGLFNQGSYWTDTFQRAVSIRCYKNDTNVDKIAQSIEYLLPHIKPLSDGYKHFGIFEKTFSSGGSYGLKIKDADTDLTITTYGREKLIKRFDTIRDAIVYISQYVYYED